MVEAKLACRVLIQNCLCVLLFSRLTHATESDINCLRTIKSQLKDPNGYLSSWVFGNDTKGYICKFSGVSCWNDEENRVLGMELGGFGLEGEFPSGVKEFSSLQGLSLQGNKLYGTIPSDVFSSLQFLTTLDLSNNNFSGKIPASLSDLTYLTSVLLDHNQFTGHIPSGLALSKRLDQFSVSHNRLQGPIPEFSHHKYFPPLSFEDNQGLCGFPMDPCPPDEDSVFHIATIIAACAAAVFLPVGAAIGWFCI